MIKLLTCAVVAALFASVKTQECATLREYVETACDYKNPLTITSSSPEKLVLEKKNCNVEFDKTKWEKKPSVSFPSAKPDKTYTIVCVDPDAPQHKKGEYYLHWIGINIPGNDLKVGDVSKGTNIKPYKGPGPPKGTGLHRYIFLIFEETEKNQAVENTKQRQKFELVKWVQSQPKKLCGPVAGLQFQAKFEKP